MNGKRTVFNYLMNVFRATIALLFPVITIPRMMDIFGSSEVGIITIGLSRVSLFLVFSFFGLQSYGVKVVAHSHGSEKFSDEVRPLIILNIMSSLVGLIFYLAFCLITVPDKKELELSLALSGVLVANSLSFEWFLQGLARYKLIAQRTFIIQASSLVFFYLLINDPSDLQKYIILLIYSSVGTAIINVLFVFSNIKLNTPQHHRVFWIHFQNCLFYFFSNVMGNFYTNIPIIYLGRLGHHSAVAYWGIANKLIQLFKNTFLSTLGNVFLSTPEVKEKKDETSAIINTLEAILPISLLGVIFSGIWASDIFIFIFGVENVVAVVPFVILLPSIIFVAISQVIGVGVLIKHSLVVGYLKAISTGALISVLIIPFIPRAEAIGPSIVNSIAELVIALSMLYNTKKIAEGTLILKTLLKYLLMTAVILSPAILYLVFPGWKKIYIKLAISLLATILTGYSYYRSRMLKKIKSYSLEK